MSNLQVKKLYEDLLTSWNRRDAPAFAALFTETGAVVGFDGSQYEGRNQIESELGKIFHDHPTPAYVGKVREISFVTSDVAILRAIAGLVPPGQADLNPDLNAVQSLVAVRRGEQWGISLFQNTPAQLHLNPDERAKLTEELRELL
jgi:uncharacterized protein (TIGR02246 family)